MMCIYCTSDPLVLVFKDKLHYELVVVLNFFCGGSHGELYDKQNEAYWTLRKPLSHVRHFIPFSNQVAMVYLLKHTTIGDLDVYTSVVLMQMSFCTTF